MGDSNLTDDMSTIAPAISGEPTTAIASSGSQPVNTTSPYASNPTPTSSKYPDLLVATYVASGFAMVGVALTLFSYLGLKKFRVKRTHMVLVNLCICLLLYFISYSISNYRRHHNICSGPPGQACPSHRVCIAGAFLNHLAVLSSWFWVVSYWILLLFMYKHPLRGHISHFFIKSALPCYGLPLLASVVTIGIASENGHLRQFDSTNSSIPYANQRCFVNESYFWAGLVAPFSVAAIVVLSVFAYVLQGLAMKDTAVREGTNKKRVKIHLIKLSIITIVTALVFVSTVIIPAGGNEDSKVLTYASTICFVISAIALGLLLMILFCFLQTEIRLHWSAVISGRNRPRPHHASKHNGMFNHNGSRKSSANSRQAMLCGEEDGESGRKYSTMKIIPKDDTDLSNLNLIPIPNTPTQEQRQKRKSQMKENNDEIPEVEKNIKKSSSTKSESKRSSTILKKHSFSGKIQHDSPEDDRPVKAPGSTAAVEKRINRGKGDAKRRSFSTSSIKPESGRQLSLLKRQSVLSNDSTRLTNFD